MASSPSINVTRDKLFAIFKNHELVRAFELLFREVTVVIPGDNTIILGIAQQARSNSEGLALGAIGPRASVPADHRAGEGLVETPDAAGKTFGLDVGFAAMASRSFGPRPSIPVAQRQVNDGDLVMAMRAFANRPPAPIAQRPPNDAQDILATRVFNRR